MHINWRLLRWTSLRYCKRYQKSGKNVVLMKSHSRVENTEAWEIIMITMPALPKRKSETMWDCVTVADRKDIWRKIVHGIRPWNQATRTKCKQWMIYVTTSSVFKGRRARHLPRAPLVGGPPSGATRINFSYFWWKAHYSLI